MNTKLVTIIGLIFIVSTLNTQCKDEMVKPISNTNSINGALALDTIWSRALPFSINPILNGNGDILMSNQYDISSNNEVFKLFDGTTGELKWQWNDYFRTENDFNDERHTIINDELILCSHNATYALNILTGKTTWKHYMDTMYGEPFIFKDDDGYLYHGFKGEKGSYNYFIFRTKYNVLNWELLCTFHDSTNKFDNLTSLSLSVINNIKNEKVILYTLTSSGSVIPNAKICCYNINKNKYDWIKDYSNKYAFFSTCKMLTTSQKAFGISINGATAFLTAINISDGTLVWEKTLPEWGVNLFLYNNNIVSICSGSSPIQCYDQNTGNLVWQQNFTPTDLAKLNFTFGDANIFKNYLFSTQCKNLLVLNLDNGAVIYNKQVALPEGCLQYGVAINEQKRWFYVQDRNNVVCYKLPIEIKY